MDNAFRVTFSHLLDGSAHNFLHRFIRGIDSHVFVTDPRDGEQVFHHIDQPVGILIDILYDIHLIRLAEFVLVFQVYKAVTQDPGEWRPQVVGDSAQQVSPHSLDLCFCKLLFPFLDQTGLGMHMDPHGAYPYGDGSQEQKGSGIPTQGRGRIRCGIQIQHTKVKHRI